MRKLVHKIKKVINCLLPEICIKLRLYKKIGSHFVRAMFYLNEICIYIYSAFQTDLARC